MDAERVSEPVCLLYMPLSAEAGGSCSATERDNATADTKPWDRDVHPDPAVWSVKTLERHIANESTSAQNSPSSVPGEREAAMLGATIAVMEVTR
jgi:hypothetical protein